MLLAQLGTFPARDLVEQWLKAGVVEQGRFTPTEEGTPQGGVVSPVLLNVALHGMERAAGVRYQLIGTHAGKTVTGSPVLIRYADDLVALCTTKAQAERGQGTSGRVAGAQRAGLQRGQDAHRQPRRGLRLPGIHRPPLSGQAADQTEQGGPETSP